MATSVAHHGSIGVFDSGVGGLSVLRAVHHAVPRAGCVYMADNLHAPYGERDGDFVRERSLAMAGRLIDEGCTLLVVACNTATAWGLDAMRARWPGVPMVGVEPGLKPAAATTQTGRIAVLATPATLRSARFRRLAEQHGAGHALLTPACDGLAAAIERADPDDAELNAMLDRIGAELVAGRVDTVVLGCTHYPFALQALRARAPGVRHWIDTAEAIARRVVALAASAAPQPGPARLLCTGTTEALDRMAQRWLAGEWPAALRIQA
jgi:glutamate racemase